MSLYSCSVPTMSCSHSLPQSAGNRHHSVHLHFVSQSPWFTCAIPHTPHYCLFLDGLFISSALLSTTVFGKPGQFNGQAFLSLLNVFVHLLPACKFLFDY
ncbi:hypothetical protein ILYODFUR_037615 [Ilyodon furcidens]|uniref:Uncharacterized protein n=1 Tax=Ilyodon furcidens TaxID=33524 RepID=A0ABV0UBP8_9TELE